MPAPCRSAPPPTPLRSTTPGSPRSSRTPASGSTSPTTCSPSSGRPTEGWHDARIDAVRPAHAGPGHRRPALRAGDLRGHEGLPPRATARSGPSARRRTPSGWCARAAGWRSRCCEPDDFVAGGRRAGQHRPALGAGRRGGEEPLRPAVHDRLRDVPRGAARAARHVHGDRLAGRRLLQGRRQAGHAVADRGVHPRRPRRHGRGQDRRQLRQLAGRAAGGHRARLRPGGLPRRPGGPVRRGARRHEHVLRLRRRPHRHPRDRHHPRGHHPRRRSSSSPASSATRSRSAGSPSTSGATA